MRPDNLFNSSLAKIQKEGYKELKAPLKDLRDGDLFKMSNDGELWCKIDNAKYLRAGLKGVEFVQVWRI